MLVCKAWKIRAQMHLFSNVSTPVTRLPIFGNSLKSTRYLRSFIRRLTIFFDIDDEGNDTMSAFCMANNLQNLEFLHLVEFDLTREHPSIFKVPLLRPVKHLHLLDIRKCSLSQLVRFINMFHSLSSMILRFQLDTLEHHEEILPKPSRVQGRSLAQLDIHLIPGIGKFLDWCMKEEMLLVNIRKLVLRCYLDGPVVCSCFQEAGSLLQACKASVTELHLDFRTEDPDTGVLDLCELTRRRMDH